MTPAQLFDWVLSIAFAVFVVGLIGLFLYALWKELK